MLFKNYSLAEVKYFWEDLENSTHLPTTNYEDTVVGFLAHFWATSWVDTIKSHFQHVYHSPPSKIQIQFSVC